MFFRIHAPPHHPGKGKQLLTQYTANSLSLYSLFSLALTLGIFCHAVIFSYSALNTHIKVGELAGGSHFHRIDNFHTSNSMLDFKQIRRNNFTESYIGFTPTMVVSQFYLLTLAYSKYPLIIHPTT